MFDTPADVIEYWMGDVLADVAHLSSAFERWFQGGEAVDAEIRERFGDAVEQALDGGLQHWEQEIASSVALVILLDQFPRNIFRKMPRAFAGDERALAVSRRWAGSTEEEHLAYVERIFLLMPFQHSEDAGIQRESVQRFRQLEDEACQTGEPCEVVRWLASTREYAELHRDIVLEFGRFPHRNAILGRDSSAAEQAWLEQGGQRFGQ